MEHRQQVYIQVETHNLVKLQYQMLQQNGMDQVGQVVLLFLHQEVLELRLEFKQVLYQLLEIKEEVLLQRQL
jgi:hypothetical protein